MASQYEVGKLTKVAHRNSRKGSSSKYKVEIAWGHESAKPLVEQMPTFTLNEIFGYPIELVL